MTEATVLALVAIVGSVITALFKLLNDNTKALNALVTETKQGNIEAKERNGHLGEQNVQITELIAAHTEKTIEAIDNLKTQHIDTQLVNQLL